MFRTCISCFCFISLNIFNQYHWLGLIWPLNIFLRYTFNNWLSFLTQCLMPDVDNDSNYLIQWLCLFCVHPCLTGIYFYNSHPIYKVDVLGTVVYRRERDDFFCYGGNLAESLCGRKIFCLLTFQSTLTPAVQCVCMCGLCIDVIDYIKYFSNVLTMSHESFWDPLWQYQHNTDIVACYR